VLVYYLEYGGYWVELPRGDTLIGRDVHCALRFNDPAVSRQHLRIERRGGDVVIEDLGSSNGTLVNGAELAGARKLVDNDRIRLGARELAFRVIDDEAEEQQSTRREVSLATFSQLDATHRPTTPQPHSVGAKRSQRCPKCGAAVVAGDARCASCGHDWDQVRPRAATLESYDRRGHERVAIELHLVYRSAELEIEATTRDLSNSGVFVCTQVLEPMGTQCELTILVDGGPPVSHGGVVRRVVEQAGSEPVGLGIEFVAVGDAERRWLDAAVERGNVTQPIELP